MATIRIEDGLTAGEIRAVQAHRRAIQNEEQMVAQSDVEYLQQYFQALLDTMVRDYRRDVLPGLIKEYEEQLLNADDETIEKIISLLPPKQSEPAEAASPAESGS